uniref:NADH-ubiquinone oxidoreductase chain 4L n=1 Tax=Callionymus maculatus TaxID=508551 RepID=A0A7H1R6H7_9TELE|nr:NADH dehydrogenase subunit 4L [Callionymus maculatus]
MTLTNFSFFSTFLLAMAGLSFNRAHLLSALLCLEGMMLSLFLGLSLWTLTLATPSFSAAPMFLLTFCAAAAAAGLALLAATARTHGSDHLKTLNLLQC